VLAALRDRIVPHGPSSCALAALLFAACSREPKPGTGPASAASSNSTTAPASGANPFVRSYPFATATITYAKKDGNFEQVI